MREKKDRTYLEPFVTFKSNAISKNDMNESDNLKTYQAIIPLSMCGVLIAFMVACFVLALVIRIKRLHTVSHLLICNTSISSIFYCIVNCVNYMYLLFVTWETSDLTCRWRGYFGYMAFAAVIYSYLAQAISRFFIAMLSIRYPWITSFRVHITLILIQWIIVLLVPLPAILTNHIIHRPSSLCWVPRKYTLHLIYMILAYYIIPAMLISVVHMYIYLSVKYPRYQTFILSRTRRAKRDLEILFNIMILFAIYTLGAIPMVIFVLTNIEFLYAMGIVSASFTVAIEKLATLVLDRDIRNIIRNYFRRSLIQIRPIS